MMKIFRAKALARILGEVTLARIVLLGPVFRNNTKTARKITTQQAGNGVTNINPINGTAVSIPIPDTQK
jgi:hypothetical protein